MPNNVRQLLEAKYIALLDEFKQELINYRVYKPQLSERIEQLRTGRVGYGVELCYKMDAWGNIVGIDNEGAKELAPSLFPNDDASAGGCLSPDTPLAQKIINTWLLLYMCDEGATDDEVLLAKLETD
jgi:hypothetical protein